MYILNSYRFGGSDLPNYSGLNIAYHWSLFKTNLSTIDYAIKVRQTGSPVDATEYYVFFDDDGVISGSSKISTTTTPGANDLDSLNTGSTNIGVTSWFCNITGTEVIEQATTTSGIPRIYTTGTIHSKNSKTSIRGFDTTRGCYAKGSAISELNDSNDFSISFASCVTTSAGTERSGIFNTTSDNTAGASRFSAEINNTTSTIMTIVRNNAGSPTTFLNNYISQQNNTDVRHIIATHDTSALEVETFLSTTSQEVVTYTTGYDNDDFILGSISGLTPYELNGHFQSFMIHDAVLSSGQISSLDTQLKIDLNF